MKNDYSKLRPFDLEAAKRGERIVIVETQAIVERTFVTGPDDHGYFVVKTGDGWFRFGKDADYRMAPLAWVEGKPVYKGDVLYSDKHGKGEIVEDLRFVGGAAIKFEGTGISLDAPYFATGLTWNPPKVKREGWVNVYQSFGGGASAVISDAWSTKEKADELSRLGRIACIRIKWEE